MNKYVLAIESFNLAIRIDYNYIEAHYNKGSCYFEMNQYELAIESFN